MTKENKTVYIEGDAQLVPETASAGSAGFDLRSSLSLVIEPGETVLIPSGIRLAMPEGLEAQVRPRSGLSLRTSLRIANSPGTIDSDYRDEVCVIAENTNSLFFDGSILIKDPDLASRLHQECRPVQFSEYFRKKTGNDLPFGMTDHTLYLDQNDHPVGSIYIEAGDRIAQLVFVEVIHPDIKLVDEVAKIGQNRGGGFGSSGIS
ncbi:MAG: aminotransferase [Eubacteriales bacterium]|nr:aminotransferase [Eubacteriales bacterium]MDD4324238.1 aminotransferase [Eubacteriales bacterium]MDD4541756.1 aminotransferase [Eubacteriales bacterium]